VSLSTSVCTQIFTKLKKKKKKQADDHKKCMNMSEDHSNQESRVDMNVGGTMFTVHVDTIMQYPDTMLGSMLSKRWANENETDKEIFLDRDPVRFRYILDFYRNGKIVIPHNTTKAEMLAEIEYFSLPLEKEDIQYDVSSIAGMKDAILEFDNRYVENLKINALEGAIVACANALAAMFIEKIRRSPSSDSVGLRYNEIPAKSFVKGMIPRVLEDKLFQATINSLLGNAGYTCDGEISRGLLKLVRLPNTSFWHWDQQPLRVEDDSGEDSDY